MSKEKKATEQEQKEDTLNEIAFLLHLEGAVVNGRAVVYKLVKDVMASKKVNVTTVMFSHYCVDRRPKQFVPDLLKVSGKKDGERLSGQITNGIADAFLKTSVTLAPGVEELLSAAKKENIRVGVLSGLPKKTVADLVEKLGLTDQVVAVIPYGEEEKGFPPPDAWLRLAKAVSTRPTRCVAFVGSARACGSAMAAHTRCVVIPDEYTSFQDFGGNDFLVDQPDANLVVQLLESSVGL